MMCCLRMLAVVLLLGCTGAAAFAFDQFVPVKVEKSLAQQKAAIERIETSLLENGLNEEQIVGLRTQLRKHVTELQQIVAVTSPVFDALQADIADLGPAPAGETPEAEPENIRQHRAELTGEALMTGGIIQQAEALLSKASRLLERVAAARRGQFVNQLFSPQASMFSARLWQHAGQAYRGQIDTLLAAFTQKHTAAKTGLLLSGGAFVVLFIGGVFFSRREKERVQGGEQLFGVARSLVLPVLGAAAGIFLAQQILVVQQGVSETSRVFVQTVLCHMALLIITVTAATRFAAVGAISFTVRGLGSVAVLLYVCDTLFLGSGRLLGAPVELAIGQSYFVTTIFAGLLGIPALLVLQRLEQAVHPAWMKPLCYAFCAGSFLLVVANSLGYAAFSRFVFERTIMVGFLGAGVLWVRVLVRPYLVALEQFFVRRRKSADSEAQQEETVILFWLSLFVDGMLFCFSVPVLASFFGAEWPDIQHWAEKIFFGFTIGSVTISLVSIIIAVLLFLGLLFTTRLVQNILANTILPKTNMDMGIRHSITQVFGYIGLIIALLAGIAAVGFDLSNLALIAGALSVGIGFGLQSIVSNFVSGLILLFERPIKVGDWIITDSGEGIVKKISVRATEIETFDRTSIIVPNAELIASSVKNWTHKNTMGRVIVSVGVSYDSDPHQVKELLLGCAAAAGYALRFPAPVVYFKDFGDSALVFELRFFIADVGSMLSASTQMRLDIWDSFKVADIEISFPQQDIHIRSVAGFGDSLPDNS